MDYQDFTIDLRSDRRGRLEATVTTAPLGANPRRSFPRPLSKKVLTDIVGFFDRSGAEIAQQQLAPKVSPRKLGRQLFSALFREELAELFRQCRPAPAVGGTAGLRLRLRFQVGDPQAEYLAALPWEWLCDPDSAEYLATDLGTPVVREISTARPRGTLVVKPPLRILVVDAAPSTMGELNLKLEIERMTAALKTLIDAGQVVLLQLDAATPEALRDALRDEDEEIHVLHFMGHGGYDRGSGNGAIFFVGPDGAKDPIDGEKLADFLKRIPSLRLVVLNACKTARQAGRMGGPFNCGVAAAILERTGVPAVIANQYSISDDTAVRFSDTFYGCLAAGDDVDEALTETRLRLRARTPEWATPVLFLTAPSGKLFDLQPVRRKHTTRVLSPSRKEDNPLRLGVRSIDGWGKDMEARNDRVLDLTALFQDRYIKERGWWQEKVFPMLQAFFVERVEERRPLLLDFAAHSSIAFAAGWLLEPKSGLDVRVRQRTGGEGEFDWHPEHGAVPDGPLWLDRTAIEIDDSAPDVAVALAVSQPNVAEHVQEFVQHQSLPIGRILDATIAPGPGQRSVLGGAHALRLAQALFPRLQMRRPEERGGRVHFFCAAPNALVFYLGQLSSALGRVVLYEHPFRAVDAYGKYQRSIELPPPGETSRIPDNW